MDFRWQNHLMSTSKLASGSILSPYISRVKPELGATNAKRLDQFLHIDPAEDGRYPLDSVFAELFPRQEKSKALESFKKLRPNVNQAAETVGCSLRIHIDKSRSGDLTRRFCWFEIDPEDNPELLKFAKTSSVQGVKPGGDQKSMAIAQGPVYEIFVSYAHADGRHANALLDRVSKCLNLLAAGKSYNVDVWMDSHIEPGARWRGEIDEALNRARAGLFLLSLDFLSSEFIQETEVPAFLKEVRETIEERPVVPVMLCEFPIDDYREGLGEIAARQIHRYAHTNGRQYAWNQTRTEVIEDGFAHDLAKKIIRRLDEIHKSPPAPAETDRPVPDSDDAETDQKCGYADWAARHETDFDPRTFEKNLGREGTMHDLNRLDVETGGKEVVAVDHLMNWARSEPSAKTELLAVLGEFGIGKTTTLHQFAQDLIEARKDDPNVPLPLLFDLRSYTPGRNDITLDSVLQACISAVKPDDGAKWELEPEKLIDAIRKERAIAIFDGLDEVMNSLAPKERQTFVKELWSILPPLARKADHKDTPPPQPAGRGRIIMSCRSHFFRDVFEQNGLYTGNQREGIDEDDRRMLLILPFTEDQIKSYFKSCLGSEAGEQVYGLLEEIHNLTDLAKRPLLANMIREIVPDLEKMMLDGREIHGVDLYERFIRKHLERDEGKHVFSKQHKLRLMEALAADLWISGAREWKWERLEEWLDEFLGENPAIARRYRISAEVLNQDFRNATAVVRRAGEKSDFRFAHTSLQEYFLARWMARTLETEKGDSVKFGKLSLPSEETLVFLGQLLQKSENSQAVKTLADWMEAPNGTTNLIGFRYLLIATRHGYPKPNPGKISLRGANLYRWKIQGIRVRQLDLSGAHLAETTWENVSWNGGNLDNATITQTQWKNCRFSEVEINGLKSEGAVFRTCGFGSMATPKGWRIGCTGDGVENTSVHLPRPLLSHMQKAHSGSVSSVGTDRERGRYLSGSSDNTVKVWDAETFECLATLRGHSGSVLSVGTDRERGRYLSGSDDNTVKVWDAETFECLATLRGHSGSVWSVGTDRERGRYLSGSDDKTVKVWDAETFECLATLRGHSGWVLSVGTDRERGRYLSGSDDKTVKVWDAETFECLATLRGHSGWVLGVGTDRERGRYLSGSSDKTVKVWDAETFECLATLRGHSGSVLGVGTDRERGRYLSGSSDKTVKVWDAETFECLATLRGHSGWVLGVGTDRERGRYLSGSSDNTVKVWDAETFECLATLRGHSGWVLGVGTDRERGRYLSGSSDKTVKVWDAETFECLATLRGHSGWVLGVGTDRERGRYLSGSSDNTVKVWDAETFECLATLRGHSGSVWSVGTDRERGRYLSGSDDNTVKVWDAETFECLATLRGHSGWVRSVGTDRERGRYLSGSDDKTVKVWDAETFECLATLRGHSGWVRSVGTDRERGRYLSGSDDKTVKVWDAETFECLATLRGHSGWVRSVGTDRERGRYLSGSDDKTVKVWDAETFECLATLRGHSGWVRSVGTDRERGRYLSGSDDKTVKVWDAETFECLATILQLPQNQWAVVESGKIRPAKMSKQANEHLMWVGREACVPHRLIALPFEGLQVDRPIP